MSDKITTALNTMILFGLLTNKSVNLQTKKMIAATQENGLQMPLIPDPDKGQHLKISLNKPSDWARLQQNTANHS